MSVRCENHLAFIHYLFPSPAKTLLCLQALYSGGKNLTVLFLIYQDKITILSLLSRISPGPCPVIYRIKLGATPPLFFFPAMYCSVRESLLATSVWRT